MDTSYTDLTRGISAELGQLRRALVQYVADVLDEAFAEGAVRDEKDADHAPDSNRSD